MANTQLDMFPGTGEPEADKPEAPTQDEVFQNAADIARVELAKDSQRPTTNEVREAELFDRRGENLGAEQTGTPKAPIAGVVERPAEPKPNWEIPPEARKMFDDTRASREISRNRYPKDRTGDLDRYMRSRGM